MRTFNNRQDVEDLRRDGTTSVALTEHIAEFFRLLEEELANDEEDAFRLDQHGPIVLLEAGENLRSLNVAGLNGADLRRAVEFVEPLALGDVQAYRLAAVLDNDFVVTIFTVAGTHNEEEEEWLNEQARRS